MIELCRVICNIIGKYYRCVDSGECLINRSQFLSAREQSLFSVSRIRANALIQIFPDASSFFEILNALNCSLESTSSDISLEGATSDLKTECFEKFIFVHDIMPELSTIIHDAVCETDISFTKLFQKYGNSIRKYGEIKYKFDSQELMEVDEPDIFAIPRKIVQFIKALRHPFTVMIADR